MYKYSQKQGVTLYGVLRAGMNKGQVVKLCRRIKLRLSNVRVPENSKTLGGERQMNKSSFGNPLGITRGQTTCRADKSSSGNPLGITRGQTTWMTDKFSLATLSVYVKKWLYKSMIG